MFDTIQVGARKEYVPYDKTVTHNYAPTTEQAKYLEQLNKQAWDSITNQIVHNIEDNFISAGEVHRCTDHFNHQEKVLALFTLNGEKFEVEVAVDDGKFNPNKGDFDFIQSVITEMSKQITLKLMRKAVDTREWRLGHMG